MIKALFNRKAYFIYKFIMIIAGATLAALSIELFLIPNLIIDGGIIGISLIVNHLTTIHFGVLFICFNIPFLIAGYKLLGKSFFLASLIGIISLAGVESLFHHTSPFTSTPLLATVFGGVILGAGVGLVIRHGGALDGTDIMAILLTKKIPFSIGEFIMFFNIFVFVWAGFVLGWEQAMYSIITYYIASKTIDMVVQGFEGDTKAVLIVSDHYKEMADCIITKLGRSVTKLNGKGGYINTDKEIIYVVVTRLEISKLKTIIAEIDPLAFTTIMDTQEARGSKFKSALH
ncbi:MULTISPECIES: YitT family protein [Cytobacillus]|uniref:YitT family protein n=1 Tax=Cytobacillus TaxID=2675230 RepID=UPI0025A220B3|nr:YitT family protein [Cytobacillus kochii]MDM5206825.1 YitT family protein [Cytobacillus kochii]